MAIFEPDASTSKTDYRKRVLQRHGPMLFERAHEAMTLTDTEARIIAVNPAFTRITGYAEHEVLGKNPSVLASGRHDENFYARMWEALQTRGCWDGEIWNRRASGEVYPEHLSISTLHDEEGTLEGYLATFSDLTTLKEQRDRIERIASQDMLTGLPNRALFADRLGIAYARARRTETLIAVCVMDLDRFKHINDLHGLATGDEVLIKVAQRLRAHLRAEDTVARTSGDEFTVLLGDLEDLDSLRTVLDRLLLRLADPLEVGNHTFRINASLGVVVVEPQAGHAPPEADQLLREASMALYAAKESGRNCYRFSDLAQNRTLLQRQALEDRITRALHKQELRLHYQPKVFLQDGRVDGFEALLRWQHPERGLVGPMDFLPEIEGTQLDVAVGEWVLREAFRQLDHWRAHGHTFNLSVNLSAAQLRDPGFEDLLLTLLEAYPRLHPRHIELEILESMLLEDLDAAVGTIQRCVARGFVFSLDDFGTGYSSLTWLRRIPASRVKIDRSFVFDMLSDDNARAIVHGVIQLGQAFGRQTIAEGVESDEHSRSLRNLGCELAQGYGIARPMPANQVADWLQGWHIPETWSGEAPGNEPTKALPH